MRLPNIHGALLDEGPSHLLTLPLPSEGALQFSPSSLITSGSVQSTEVLESK